MESYVVGLDATGVSLQEHGLLDGSKISPAGRIALKSN
jgi:hypothetical protein